MQSSEVKAMIKEAIEESRDENISRLEKKIDNLVNLFENQLLTIKEAKKLVGVKHNETLKKNLN